MPFVCKLQLNNGAIEKTDIVKFLEFIDAPFDSFHHEPVKIAKILFNTKPAFIYTNCSAYLSSQEKLIKDQILTDQTIIGYFSANGEDIPYYKPYAIIRFE